jgi:hypothetical protein
MFYYFFSLGLVLIDAFILFTVLRLYLKTKQSLIGILALWFGSRFLSVFLPYIWNSFLGWTTVHIQNFSVLVEGVLMVHFCKLLLAKETKLWRLLYALPVLLYLTELYLTKLSDALYYVSSVVYYVMVGSLLIWVIQKAKISVVLLRYVYILLIFHMTVMIYIINLSVVLYNSKLLFIVYPVFFTVCVMFDTVSIFYFRKHTQHFIQTTYQTKNAH